jgi:hypothetical protein
MASIYIRGVGPWACDDTAVLCDGGVFEPQYPFVDGHSAGSRRPPRRKTDPRVHDGHLLRLRPRR